MSEPLKRHRALIVPAALAVIIVLVSAPASAVDFANVVSLGDSLLNPIPGRGPVLSEHLAAKIGATHTQLAVGGSTTASLIAGGQHTTAAANFGPGDLAVVFIGGNDMVANQTSIASGDYSFIDTSEANVDIILSTLRVAGIDVVIMNLPDLAIVPSIMLNVPAPQLPNFTTAASIWRTKIDDLAATHGAVAVDFFPFSQQLQSDPTSFALFGNVPTVAPSIGSISACPMCAWFDGIHPSSMAQGFLANLTIDATNAGFGAGGTMPVSTLSDEELFSLTGAPGRVFGQTITAVGKVQFCWTFDEAVDWVGGDLSLASSYAISLSSSSGGSSVNCFTDAPSPPVGSGTYYVVRHDFPAASWQTTPGGEAGRDLALP